MQNRIVRQNPFKRYSGSPLHETILDKTSEYIKTIMYANRYLLKRGRKSVPKQMREFKDSGILIARQTLDCMKRGKYRTVYLNVLMYFEWYWGVPLNDLHELGLRIMRGEEIE